MAIHVDVLVQLRELELRRASRRLKQEAERLGEDMSDLISKGFRTDAPKVTKALNSETDAVVKLRRATVDYNKVAKNSKATGEQQRRAMENLAKAVRDADAATRGFSDTSEKEVKLARQRAEIIDGNTQAFANYERQLERSRKGMAQLNRDQNALIQSNTTLTRSFDRVTDATTKTTREQDKYNRMVQDGLGDREALIRQSHAVRDAYEKERRAIRDAAEALVRHNQAASRSGGRAGGTGGAGGGSSRDDATARLFGVDQKTLQRTQADIQGLIGSMMGLRLGGTTGMVTLVALGKVGLDLAKILTTATQAAWLLPAALSAGAAGMGTLTLATAGFNDTIEALAEGDLEKFAEEINKLSPNAQQAALSIQAILPGLSDLRKATADSFFDGIGAELERLNATYLPSVQALTTDIAGSFNSMLKGISFELMEPETQATMQSLFDNIGQFFQNIAPAARDLTQAFIDIAEVGSGFLPDMANGAADLAAQFAAFIREARESGKLKEWIQEGIDAVSLLATTIWDLAGFIYDTFGADGKQNVEDFKDTLEGVRQIASVIGAVFALLSGDLEQLGKQNRVWEDMKAEIGQMVGVAGTVRDAIMDIPEAFMFVLKKVAQAADWMAQNFTNFMNSISPFEDRVYTPMAPGIPSGGDWASGQAPPPAPASPGEWTNPATGQRMKWEMGKGWVPVHPRPPGSPADGTSRPVPAPPPDKAPSEKDQLDAAMAALDPSTYRVDPYAAVPGVSSPHMPTTYNAPGYGPIAAPPGGSGATPGIPYSGYYEVDQQAVLEADRKVVNAAHDLEEDRKKRMALEQTNLGTAEEIADAKWAELKSAEKLQEAQADLAEKQQGTWKKLGEGLEGFRSKITAGLDADLGISKGLPGLAENLVRFLATLGAAPVLGYLEAISEAQGGLEKTGSGLIGIAAQQGAFGPQYTPRGIAEAEAYANGGPAAVTALQAQWGGGTPAMPLSSIPPSKFSDSGLLPAAAQLNDIIAAYFPAVTEIGGYRPDPHPDHPSGRALDIMIPGGTTRGGQNPGGKALGDQMWEFLTSNGLIDPNGSLWQTDTGGDHYDHIHARIAEGMEQGLPDVIAGAMSAASPYGAIPGSTGLGSNIPIPLPVTIVGGVMPGGPAGGGSMGFPGMPPQLGAASGGSGTNWDAIMQGEAGGDGGWTANTGNGFYGGLQFKQSTWDQFKLPGMPGRADLATREQQIQVAERTLAEQGPGAWPNTYHLGAPKVPGFDEGGAVGEWRDNPGSIGAAAGKPFAPPFLGHNPDAPQIGPYGEYAPFPYWATPWNPRFNPDMKIDTSMVHTSGPPLGYEHMKRGRPWRKLVPPGFDFDTYTAMVGITPGSSPWQAATGGAPPGGTDTVPAMLTPGEHVLTTRDVAALGGQAGVYAFRSALHMQGGGGVPHLPPPPPPRPPAPPPPPPRPSIAAAGPNLRLTHNQPHLSGPAGLPGPGGGPFPGQTIAGAGPGVTVPGKPPGPTKIGGGEPTVQPGGGAGSGGLAGTLTQAGAMAADMFAPGSGAAVQIASQLIQRSIKFGAQALGIGAQGVLETFLPFGGSDLANNNWITRIGGAFAGVAPQIPNIAAKSASVDQMMAQWQPPQPMAMSDPGLQARMQPPTPPPPLVPPQPPQASVNAPTVNNNFFVEPAVAGREAVTDLLGKQYQSIPQVGR